MLEKIKQIIGVSDSLKDNTLSFLLEQAISFVEDYTHTIYTTKFDSIIIKMVIEDWNRIGSQGKTSENYGGVSVSYADDYSPSIYKQLDKHRKIKVVGC